MPLMSSNLHGSVTSNLNNSYNMFSSIGSFEPPSSQYESSDYRVCIAHLQYMNFMCQFSQFHFTSSLGQSQFEVLKHTADFWGPLVVEQLQCMAHCLYQLL